MFKAHYDTIIIGARCAGSATALQLARTGQRVLLVEREMDPQDTLSTHALMRPAVALLRNWGLLDQIAASTPAVCATQFIYGEERLTIPVRPAPGMAGLYAPRRWVLDKVLRDAACDAGASLRLGTRCTGLVHSDKGAVIGVQLTDQSGRTELVFADRVIGADGRSSTVAKYAEAPYLAWSDHRSAVCYAYVDGLPNEGYRWFYSASAYAGLIPTNNGQHCLFTGGTPDLFRETFTPDAFEGMMQILSIWEPGMAADLRHRGPSERVRRFAGAPGFIRQCAGPGWALVGDAGYFKDPATAHGITDAFLDAQRLSDAIIAGEADLASYAAARNEGAHTFFGLTQTKAAFGHTMDQLKALHMRINACMKHEMLEVDGLLAPAQAAA